LHDAPRRDFYYGSTPKLRLNDLRSTGFSPTGETNDFDTHSVKLLASDSIFLDSYWSEVWQSIALVWGLPSQVQIQPPHPPAPSPPERGEGEKKSQDSTLRFAKLLPIERNKNLTSNPQ